MPARTKTGGVRSPTSEDNDKDSESYMLKRKRNNDAVKKAREKSKQTLQVRKENVEKLRVLNKQMEARIETIKIHVGDLKSLLLHKVDPERHDEVMRIILETDSDEENE